MSMFEKNEKESEKKRGVTNKESFAFYEYLGDMIDEALGKENPWSVIEKLGMKQASRERNTRAVLKLQGASSFFEARMEFWKDRGMDARKELKELKEEYSEEERDKEIEINGIPVTVGLRIDELEARVKRCERASRGWKQELQETYNKVLELKLPDLSRSRISGERLEKLPEWMKELFKRKGLLKRERTG